jgi:hypothetical protein
MWSSLKRWVIGGFGSILCDRGLFSGIGVLTVSTGRVVMLMSRSQRSRPLAPGSPASAAFPTPSFQGHDIQMLASRIPAFME